MGTYDHRCAIERCMVVYSTGMCGIWLWLCGDMGCLVFGYRGVIFRVDFNEMYPVHYLISYYYYISIQVSMNRCIIKN